MQEIQKNSDLEDLIFPVAQNLMQSMKSSRQKNVNHKVMKNSLQICQENQQKNSFSIKKIK